MSDSLFVLVPPSEAKREGGAQIESPGVFDAPLALPRREVVLALGELLATASTTQLEKQLNVRGPRLVRALEASRQLLDGTERVMPAWQRFDGVVWSHLDPATLPTSDRRRLLVPSGVYGLSTGEDPVADYRLKMDARLGSLGQLASFWRPFVTRALIEHVGAAVLVNLLPREHSSSIEASQLSQVDVAFVQPDGRGAAGHAAKAVKGIFARRLLLDGLTTLDTFHWEGWRMRREQDAFHVVAPR